MVGWEVQQGQLIECFEGGFIEALLAASEDLSEAFDVVYGVEQLVVIAVIQRTEISVFPFGDCHMSQRQWVSVGLLVQRVTDAFGLISNMPCVEELWDEVLFKTFKCPLILKEALY